MKTLGDVTIGLLEQLTDKKNNGGGAVAANVVLGGGGSRNHDGGGVLNLHFAEEDVSVLGQLDLSVEDWLVV